MSTAITSQLIGRFGNQLFQFCHAYAFAQQNKLELRLPHWVGEEIFDLPSYERSRGDEQPLGEYRQAQKDLIYTRAEVKSWLKWRPEVEKALRQDGLPKIAAHLRRGDYFGYGYPVVSLKSYLSHCETLGFDPDHMALVSEESGGTAWLQDFYRLQRAEVLLRANSSFSWWAATLGGGQVFSPVIDGLGGGREHDCAWVEGNWPKLANLDFTTDLHLREA